MEGAKKLTSADLMLIPDDGKRYELIDGELYVSEHPHVWHQFTCGKLVSALSEWSDVSGDGLALITPGLVLGEYDEVVPDVMWISGERLTGALDQDGHFTRMPELVVEVLSLGKENERRDREIKHGLYSRRGVSEYWIVDWMQRLVEVYRREGDALTHAITLYDNDVLESPLLSGFSCQVAKVFFTRPSS
ncbi:MAG TPA: Uma2 family endonuclease [Pyrinomonadaceae bacterium]